MSLIRFNPLDGKPVEPTLLLRKRGGDIIGKIPYENLQFSLVAKGVDEISFDVHKTKNGKEFEYWDKLIDLCIIDYMGYGLFEAHITTNDELETIKSVTCISLEGAELGQQIIREGHYNDDASITIIDKDEKFIPTVLWDENDLEHSLLYRVIKDKAPHWSIGHVDPRLNINGTVYETSSSQRVFTVDGTSIYDFLEGDVSTEFCCVFKYDTYNRTINCYNLDECVYDIRNNKVIEGAYYVDGAYYNYGDIDIKYLGYLKGIGEDTTILVSKNKLAKSFTRDSDKDAIKNCFYVTGGDDDITYRFAAANGTGNNYIYLFDQFQYDDMSENLSKLIKDYSSFLQEKTDEYIKLGGVYVYDSTCTYKPETDSCVDANGKILPTAKHKGTRVYVIDPYSYIGDDGLCYDQDDKPYSTENAFYEEPGLYTKYTQVIDRIGYLEHWKFPDTKPQETTAEQEFNKIVEYFSVPENKVIITTGCSPTSFSHVTGTVESMLEVLCDPRYKVKVETTGDVIPTCNEINKENPNGNWKAKITIKRQANEEDVISKEITVPIRYCSVFEDQTAFCRQKVQIAISKYDLSELKWQYYDNDHMDDFKELLNKYNLTSLKSFRDGFQSCADILDDAYSNIGLDKDNPALTSETMIILRGTYMLRRNVANDVYENRLQQVDDLKEYRDALSSQIEEFKKSLDEKTYFINHAPDGQGVKYYNEFRSYVREDEYNNPNYVSDGLTDAEILNKCLDLKTIATAELKKACVIQYSIQGDLNNIFALDELAVLHDKFELYNYVRSKIDDKMYKLRLMQIDYSFTSPETLNVTFAEEVINVDGIASDVQNILSNAQSMATSYSATTKQAQQGASALSNFTTIQQEGFNSAKYLIKNDNTEDVTFGNTGIFCKSMMDDGIYSDNQLRLTHNGLYLTEDNWNNIGTAVGRFKVVNDKNPDGRWVFGVNTEYIIGKIIAGENLSIGNERGSVDITGDGITLDGGKITWTSPMSKDGVAGLNDDLKKLTDDLGTSVKNLNDFESQVRKDFKDIQKQIDGEITTWFYNYEPHPFGDKTEPNAPASNWTTDSEKIKHEGDIFYNSSDGSAYRYVYTDSTKQHEWVIITDEAIAKALAAASKAQDTADHKRRVFYDTPFVPYEKGDLWSKTDSNGNRTDLLICNQSKSETQSYSESDWIKATNYTDDSSLIAFIEGDYADAMSTINTSLDGKSETWYQASDPSTQWKDDETKDKHIYDLWYNTTVNKSYMYVKDDSGYSWKESDGVPDSVYNRINGKAAIFVQFPTKKDDDGYLYRESDLLVPTETILSETKTYLSTPIIVDTYFKVGDKLWFDGVSQYSPGGMYIIYKNGSTNSITITEDYKYYEIEENVNQIGWYGCHAYKKTTYTFNKNTMYKSIAARKDNVVYTDWQATTVEDVELIKEDFSKFQQQVQNTLNVTEIGSDYIISPKIGGGYLYITSSTNSVEINPNVTDLPSSLGTKSGNIIDIKHKINDTWDSILKVDTSGNLDIKGNFTSKYFTANQNGASINGNLSSTYLQADSNGIRLGTTSNPYVTINSSGATFNGNLSSTYFTANSGGVILGAFSNPYITINNGGATFYGNITSNATISGGTISGSTITGANGSFTEGFDVNIDHDGYTSCISTDDNSIILQKINGSSQSYSSLELTDSGFSVTTTKAVITSSNGIELWTGGQLLDVKASIQAYGLDCGKNTITAGSFNGKATSAGTADVAEKIKNNRGTTGYGITANENSAGIVSALRIDSSNNLEVYNDTLGEWWQVKLTKA